MNSKEMFELPKWLTSEINSPVILDDEKDQMNFVLRLAIKNVENETGGPFAAAVFNSTTKQLVSTGVNLVVESNCSIAHAEVVALTLAEEELKSYSLENHILVSSAQPCVMCNGAVLWAGINTLIYGATKDDVERIVGFDEGPLHPQWENEFKKRGIKVLGSVQREEAQKVLQLYKDKEGIVY